MTLAQLCQLFADAGCTKLYAKLLAANDNSKNQVYFAGAVEVLNIFPSREIFAANTKNGPSFKAQLNFGWLLDNGMVSVAPSTQLILYAQYPEVRLSGFLEYSKHRPSNLMGTNARIPGRVLFLGVTRDERILGYVVPPDSQIAREFRALKDPPKVAVFTILNLPSNPVEGDSRTKLLSELHRINQLGWIASKQLHSNGELTDCNAPQCGGFTLEAELGIPKNSASEPDYLGWEVKQHAVSNFQNSEAGVITLMTPEPTGGFYKEQGVEAFIRRFGYPDRNDIPDRLNFGGIHKIGARHPLTGLTMRLDGYDVAAKKILDANGSLALFTDSGEIAAAWAFSGLFKHWSRKHTKAAYVPSICRKEPKREYSYGSKVRLAQGTHSLYLLQAFATCAVYYDPGIKLENAASPKPTTKRRSQFRIPSKSIPCLYDKVEIVEL
jgi:hypothetical protein